MEKINIKFKLFLFLTLALPIIFLFSACGEDELKTFSEAVFSNQTVDYDGQEHQIVLSGNVPEGATVVYQNNKATNAGEYNASVTITMEGYKPLTLTAKLKINKLNYDMSNAAWNYNQEGFTYDGSERTVEVNGLPDGVSVQSYSNNRKTNAGNYTASVEFLYDTINHNAPTMPTLNWQIKKASYDMSNAAWNYSSPFVFDGAEKEVLVVGLPEGVTVGQYSNNRKTDVGTYSASATLNYDAENYNTVAIENCAWKIMPDVSQLATTILSNLVQVPQPWQFLPESFSLENKAYEGSTAIDFTSFVSVSTLPKVAMGKQMNVVYSTLMDMDVALDYLRYLYGSLNVMIGFYQAFINDNPENYATYEKQTDNFTFKVVLNDDDYQILIAYNSAAIELSYELATQSCCGRIQLSNSNVLKYEMSENELTIAIDILNVSLTKLHFERVGSVVEGSLHEFVGTEQTNLKTSALIKVDETYTSIISNKRESDDMKIEGYMEVYKNSTGNLVGAEVRETVSSVKYETGWFNIWDITNINTIKVIHEANGLNMDTIYINGSADPIKTKLVGGLSLKAASRRFDIEMKDMFLYTYNLSEQKYEKVKISIPMLFVQNDYINVFAEDFYDKNAANGAISPTTINLNNTDKTYMLSEYDALIDEYLVIKEEITYQNIIDYIGTKNEYFN